MGGVLCLLPFVIVAVLLAYVYQIVVTAHEYLRPLSPFDSTTGLVLLFVCAIAVLIIACFVAGLLARRAIGARFSGTIEKQLMKVYPKYGIYKDLLAGKIGGDENVPSLQPVLVKREGIHCLAFQADRLSNGSIVAYFPGSPDTWSGSIALVAQENVQPLNVSFAEVLGICERLGRDSRSHLNEVIVDGANRDRADVHRSSV
jgi:uncharacterized membrane protein